MKKKFFKYKNLLLGKLDRLNKKRKVVSKKTLLFIHKKPFTSFFATLGILLVLIILGNLFFSPKVAPPQDLDRTKNVQIYKLGSAPQVAFQGKIEKSGVVKIVAQASGIVSQINVFEGQEIGKGTNILSLSTNYSGGNISSISRQIAAEQLKTAKETYDLQKDTIAKQREIADKNQTNSDLVKQVLDQSAIDTRSLLSLQQSIVDGIVSNISGLEATNVGGANDAAILQAKQQLSQFQAALVQTNSAFKNLEIQANQASDQTSALMYQIALKQLDLQEKNLQMSLEVTRLSYNMALVAEANMYPSTPFAGTVDRIFVKVGQNISSGDLLASISGFDQTVEVVVNVPETIAKNISVFEPSTLYIKGKEISMMPSYVSKDATNGILYSVIYQLDNSFSGSLTNLSFIEVKIPIGAGDTSNVFPFIPLDSVIQTQEEAFVFIIDEKNTARAKKITLGEIQGRYVEVLSGLPENSQVILDRNVIEGDKVSVDR